MPRGVRDGEPTGNVPTCASPPSPSWDLATARPTAVSIAGIRKFLPRKNYPSSYPASPGFRSCGGNEEAEGQEMGGCTRRCSSACLPRTK